MVIQIEKAMESKESQMRNLSYLQSILKKIVAFTSLPGLNTFSLEVCMIGCSIPSTQRQYFVVG